MYGVDYPDTFSTVAKLTSIHILIALAATYNQPLFQLDVTNAFLQGTLYEEVYMEQPLGFVAQGESGGLVCKLKKSLHGLKQFHKHCLEDFLRLYFLLTYLHVEMIIVSFMKSQGEANCSLIVYVDTGDDLVDMTKLKTYLCNSFIVRT